MGVPIGDISQHGDSVLRGIIPRKSGGSHRLPDGLRLGRHTCNHFTKVIDGLDSRGRRLEHSMGLDLSSAVNFNPAQLSWCFTHILIKNVYLLLSVL